MPTRPSRWWTSQPNNPQPIAFDNPITNGLIAAFVPAWGYDPVSGTALSLGSRGSFQDGQLWLGSSGSATDCGRFAALENATEYTVFIVATPSSLGTRRDLYTKGASWNLASGYSTSSALFLYTHNDGGSTYINEFGSGSLVAGVESTISLSGWGGASASFDAYVDGKNYTPTFGNGNNLICTSTSNFQLGEADGGSNSNWQGGIRCMYWWNRRLSVDEHLALLANRWRIFAKTPRMAIFGVATTSNIVTVSVVARTTARGIAAVAPTKAPAVIARGARIRGTEGTLLVKTSAVSARAARLRGTDGVLPSRATAIAARGAQLRGTDGVLPSRAIAIAVRGARLRGANQAAPTGITIVNIAARAARMRATDAIVPLRSVVVATRAARLRGTDAVSITRSSGIAARGARLRGAAGISSIRTATAAGRRAFRGIVTAATTGMATLVNVSARVGRVLAMMNSARKQPTGSRPGFRFGDGEFRPRGERTRRPTFKG